MVTGTFQQNRMGTMLFAPTANTKFAMSKGNIPCNEKDVEWETHDFDIGGVVISGGPMRLEIDGQGEWDVRVGDAFYVKAGLKHRGRNLGQKPIKLICAYSTPQL